MGKGGSVSSRGEDCDVRRRTGEYRRRAVAGHGFGVLGGTKDADQIAPLGE